MSAREFLSQRGIAFDTHLVEQAPVDQEAALALARRARRLFVKTGQEILRFDIGKNPITEAQILMYLVHEDGLLRVPVLVLGDLVVRGYTEPLYREALEGAS